MINKDILNGFLSEFTKIAKTVNLNKEVEDFNKQLKETGLPTLDQISPRKRRKILLGLAGLGLAGLGGFDVHKRPRKKKQQ